MLSGRIVRGRMWLVEDVCSSTKVCECNRAYLYLHLQRPRWPVSVRTRRASVGQAKCNIRFPRCPDVRERHNLQARFRGVSCVLEHSFPPPTLPGWGNAAHERISGLRETFLPANALG
jgi:hypothetical protein